MLELQLRIQAALTMLPECSDRLGTEAGKALAVQTDVSALSQPPFVTLLHGNMANRREWLSTGFLTLGLHKNATALAVSQRSRRDLVA